ncbi:glycosyltransferase family 4 protein [Octadecabacter sp. 1_MG-2023]|uniref:glycosyltransferase family 4 protein n=1 Tax=unclassified Octadecabacter TaxID=196158 RepID=UPI001C099418|nr:MULTISPECIES: glycosyltransferase family 4 protein [unclassified Octadecabacter]MBU2994052.1 glycosyltransferase family 4 protein [Octadecabacter sp. B2R22]MDO6736094.1 glycosyltransferase family 4 protein [Octadecabacter sp. 1_MG-2023]
MKITFLNPIVRPNGGNRVVSIYAKKLLERGHDVTVVSRLPFQPSLRRRIKYKLTGTKDKWDIPGRTAYYDDMGARHVEVAAGFPIDPDHMPDADAVIATWWRTAFEVAALPPEKGAKVYFVQHHEVHDHLPWDITRSTYYLPLNKITIADWLVDTMADEYGDTDVVKVENSVDTDHFNAPPRARNAQPTVGLLYSNVRFKGLDISLRAIEIARAAFPDLKVVAFGAKDPTPDLPLPPVTQYYKQPSQDLIPELYAQCDVWLCGSRAEGFHLPPLEAMGCRCPVVSTRIGGAVEVVTEGVNGHIVDVEDAEALGARLIDVLERSPDDWQAMSDAAYEQARSYTWDDAAKAFEAALVKIAGTS